MKNIEVISRAVLLNKKKILVCKDKKNKNYFLPGGHVEFGEFSKDALLRELKEEVSLDIKKAELIGVLVEINANLLKDENTRSGFYWSGKKGRDVVVNEGTICDVSVTIEENRPISLVIPLLKEKLLP